MAGFSRHLQRALLDHVLKTSAYPQPTNIYVALFSAAPSDTGGGTELSGNGYARVNHNTWNAASDASPSIADNNGEIAFPAATGAWLQATHFALFDSATLGNQLGWNALTTPKTAGIGDVLRFASGELDVTLD